MSKQYTELKATGMPCEHIHDTLESAQQCTQGNKTKVVRCSGCNKRIRRDSPPMPYSYCRVCRGR